MSAPDFPPETSGRTGGRAAFAALAWLTGLGFIAALQRVGAPDGFVRALGPVLAMAALVVVGVEARASNLAGFIAARRAAPPLHAGLAFVAVAAGLALGLDPQLATRAEPTRAALALGLALAGLIVGPALRRFGAAAPSDALATRFHGSPLRPLLALVLALIAALAALAGFEVARDAVQALVAPSPLWAEALVALTLALTLTPGGLSSVLWCGAASGAGILLIAMVGFAVGWLGGAAPPDPATMIEAAHALPAPLDPAPALAGDVAAALAVGFFFAFAPAAAASPSPRAARLSGWIGLALALTLGALAAADLTMAPVDLSRGAPEPSRAAYFGAAALLAALALARGGVEAAARAWGFALGAPRTPFPTLASVRMARLRLGMAAIVAGAAVAAHLRPIDAPTALVAALALSLAFVAPLLALAAIERAGPAAGGVALVVALGALAARALTLAHAPTPGDILRDALVAAAAAFIAGALTSLVAPRRVPAPARGDFDPFREGAGRVRHGGRGPLRPPPSGSP